jgi:hypothetical protein
MIGSGGVIKAATELQNKAVDDLEAARAAEARIREEWEIACWALAAELDRRA